MVKVPISVGKELMQAMSMEGNTSSTKTRVLFVDEEMYGPMEFPKSFILGRGQVLKLAAYGKVQVTAATVDTLHCTKEINEDFYNEHKRNPPTSDIDFTNDPITGGISADIARSLSIPINRVGEAARSPIANRKSYEPPNPGDARGDETPAKFL